MKRLLLIAGVISVFALSSCLKEKTCVCTTVIDGGTAVESVAYVTGGQCSDLNEETTIGGYTTKVTCVEE